MVAPFNQAWMLLKQRGHELNLPPPQTGNKPTGFTPQELTDKRVDEATMARGALDEFELLNDLRYPTFSNSREARNELGRRQEITNEMESQMSHAKAAEFNEKMAENMQRKLDRQTLARMGQQPEADEMEAMGMPEMDETGMPISRTLSATPPPNVGRAGSSGRPPVGSDDISNELASHDPDWHNEYVSHLNRLGPMENPFTQKPVVQQDAENRLMNWAAGAGRKKGGAAMPDKIYPEELMEPPIEGFHNSPAPADESAPTPMDIPNTVTTSPRMSRKNRPGESAPTPRLEGRAQRKGLPF
jgi:hypothetical protein